MGLCGLNRVVLGPAHSKALMSGNHCYYYLLPDVPDQVDELRKFLVIFSHHHFLSKLCPFYSGCDTCSPLIITFGLSILATKSLFSTILNLIFTFNRETITEDQLFHKEIKDNVIITGMWFVPCLATVLTHLSILSKAGPEGGEKVLKFQSQLHVRVALYRSFCCVLHPLESTQASSLCRIWNKHLFHTISSREDIQDGNNNKIHKRFHQKWKGTGFMHLPGFG